jgi:hypothetical protein
MITAKKGKPFLISTCATSKKKSPRVRKELQRKSSPEYPVLAESFPCFMFPSGYEYNKSTLKDRFLRSEFLVRVSFIPFLLHLDYSAQLIFYNQVFRAIFMIPLTLREERMQPRPIPTKAKFATMKEVTPHSLAYTAVMVGHIVFSSSVMVFTRWVVLTLI